MRYRTDYGNNLGGPDYLGFSSPCFQKRIQAIPRVRLPIEFGLSLGIPWFLFLVSLPSQGPLPSESKS